MVKGRKDRKGELPDAVQRVQQKERQQIDLSAGDVFNALLMTTSSKLCVEEFVETLAAYVFAEWLRFGVHFCFFSFIAGEPYFQ